MTVNDLLTRASSAELGEWMAYYLNEQEPFEPDLDTDLHKFFGKKR